MNLIDRYIQHIGQHLPEKSREDVLREVRSLVEDTLEDRSRALGRPIDEPMTVEVLKEFGRPEKMAASYIPERYLISPRMFPIFLLVVKIVLSVLFAITLVQLFIGLGNADAKITQLLLRALTSFADGSLSALGNIVLVFAIIQYFMPQLGKELDKEDNWNPLKMESIKDEDQVSRVGQAFGITFSVSGLALFNFFPELLGFSFVRNGELVFMPALSETFFTYLPWINLVWGAEIILSVFLLILGHWQTATRWVSIAINAFSVGLAGFMLAGLPLVGLNPADIATSGIGFPLDAATVMVSLLNQMVIFTLVLIIVIDGFDIAKQIYKFLRRNAL